MAIDHIPDEQTTELDVETLPWWHSWLNLTVIAVAIAALCGGVGYLVGNNTAIADPNAADVGFLQDMRDHHEQAIQMAFIYLNTAGTDEDLRTIAREIVVGQELEVGRMIQLLRDFGKPETNPTDTSMVWMGEPHATDSMPGLATQSDLQTLAAATGAQADALFVQLMTAHHQGGIHMAQAAAVDAATSEVRKMAGQMVTGEQEEITEMAQLLAVVQAG